MLEIKDLHVSVEGTEILKGIDLKIDTGQLHAVMGPNGSGKSTFAQVLAGRDTYDITRGEIIYQGMNLLEMSPEDRAREGIFLSFQYPVVLPGVNNTYFLQAALNAHRKHRGEEEMDAVDFLELIRDKIKVVELDDSFLQRPVNEGFSGGEKKRNEILQMLVLEPRLAILDETDSGLDIDALKVVAQGVKGFRSQDRSFLLITHYQRILNYIEPDQVHVLLDGRIAKSGGAELAHELEAKGYGWIRNGDGSDQAAA
jgi:Fe-S cluster assembly ATP-binding protein